MDDGLEKKVSVLDSASKWYYGRDFVEADLVPGSELVFSYNKNKERSLGTKTVDMVRAGVVEVLKLGGYVAGFYFLYTFLQ
jgi:hypothetical protein